MKLNRKSRIGLALAGSVALIGVAGAAYASPPWVITDGVSSSGVVPYTAAAPGTLSIPAVHFTTGAADMTCASSAASGDITLGTTPSSGPDTGKFGTITDISFSGCKALGILDMEVVDVPGMTGSLGDWALKVTDDAVSGVSDGQVYDVHAHVQDTGTPKGAACSLDVDGLVSAKFDAGSQQLIVDGDELVVSGVTGCFGLAGSTAEFTATYDVSGGDFGVTP